MIKKCVCVQFSLLIYYNWHKIGRLFQGFLNALLNELQFQKAYCLNATKTIQRFSICYYLYPFYITKLLTVLIMTS